MLNTLYIAIPLFQLPLLLSWLQLSTSQQLAQQYDRRQPQQQLHQHQPQHHPTIPVPVPIYLNNPNPNPFMVPPQPAITNPLKRFSSPFNFHNIFNSIKHFFNHNGGNNLQQQLPMISPKLMELLSNPQNQMFLENFLRQQTNPPLPNDHSFMASNNVPHYTKNKKNDDQDETVLLAAPYTVEPELISALLKIADKIPDQTQKLHLIEKVLQAAKPKQKEAVKDTPSPRTAIKIVKDLSLPDITPTNGDLSDQKQQMHIFEMLAKNYLQKNKEKSSESNKPDINEGKESRIRPLYIKNPYHNPRLEQPSHYLIKVDKIKKPRAHTTQRPIKKFIFKTQDVETPKKLSAVLESYGVNSEKLQNVLNAKTNELNTIKKLIQVTSHKNNNGYKQYDAYDKIGEESQVSTKLENIIINDNENNENMSNKSEEASLIRKLLLMLDQNELNMVGKLIHVVVNKPSFLPRILQEDLSHDVKHVLQVIQALKFPQTLMEQSRIVTTVVTTPIPQTTTTTTTTKTMAVPIQNKMWETIRTTSDKSFVPLVYWIDDKKRKMSTVTGQKEFSNRFKPTHGAENNQSSVRKFVQERIDEKRLNPNYQVVGKNEIYNSSPRVSPSYTRHTPMKATESKPTMYKISLLKETLPASVPVSAIYNSSSNTMIYTKPSDNEIPNRYRTVLQDGLSNYADRDTRWQDGFKSSDWKPLSNSNFKDEDDSGRKIDSSNGNYYDHPIAYFQGEKSLTGDEVEKGSDFRGDGYNQGYGERSFRKEKTIMFKSEEMQSQESDIDETYVNYSRKNIEDRVASEKLWSNIDNPKEKSWKPIENRTGVEKFSKNVEVLRKNNKNHMENYENQRKYNENQRKYNENQRKYNENRMKNYKISMENEQYGKDKAFGRKIISDDYAKSKKSKNQDPVVDKSDEEIWSSPETDDNNDEKYEKMRESWWPESFKNNNSIPCLTTTDKTESNEETETMETSASIPSALVVTPYGSSKWTANYENYFSESESDTTEFSSLKPKSKVIKMTTATTTSERQTQYTTLPLTTITTTTTTTTKPSTTTTITAEKPETILTTENEYMTEFEFLKSLPIAQDRNIPPISPFPVYVPKIQIPSNITDDSEVNSNFIQLVNTTQIDANSTINNDVLVSIATDVKKNNQTIPIMGYLQENINKGRVFSTVNKLHENVTNRAKEIIMGEIQQPTTYKSQNTEDMDLMHNFFPAGYWPKVLTAETTTLINDESRRRIKLRRFDDESSRKNK